MCFANWGKYYGLWPCFGPLTSSKLAAKIFFKILKLKIFYARHVKHDTINQKKLLRLVDSLFCFCLFFFFVFFSEKREKLFLIEEWFDHILFMMSYRNHSKRFSPNLCQNTTKGYAYSYWKRQMLTKILWKRRWSTTPCSPSGVQAKFHL